MKNIYMAKYKMEENNREQELKEKLERINSDNLPASVDSIDSEKKDVTEYVPDSIKSGINSLSKEDRERFVESVSNYKKKNMFKVGKICKGKECINYNECPFANFEGGKMLPLGRRCPLELMQVDELYSKYYTLFVDQYNVDPNLANVYLKEMIIIDINIDRINELLAEEGLLKENPIFGFPKSETVVTGKVANPFFSMLETLFKRKEAIFKALAITPEMMLKYKVKQNNDLLSLVEEIKRRGSKAVSRLKEEGYEKADVTFVLDKESKEDQ